MPATVKDIAETILQRAGAAPRFIVAVAGPPGAGKSTLTDELAQELPPGAAAVLQGDGFHYDNALLDRLGRRQRKGAPDTFDCRALELTLRRLLDREPDVVVPVFDRTLDVSRGSAAMIGAGVRFVIVEGNYLLADTAPWSALRPLFDMTVFIDVPRAELERRLLARWAGYGWPPEKARHWVDTNDLPNVDFVQAHTPGADVVWAQAE